MNDFRISVFLAVADCLNFSKAAESLNISQPAVTGHIRELERIYGVQLFERTRSSVALTRKGEVFYTYALRINNDYKELRYEMDELNRKVSGVLRIGVSTTIAQYILPTMMAKFSTRFPQVQLSMIADNSRRVEQMLTDHTIDIGMVENCERRRDYTYSAFARDELVLVTAATTRCRDEVTLDELKTMPLVLREEGSGTLEVVRRALKTRALTLRDMHLVMQLGSTEAIKRFVVGGKTFAIVSIASVASELYRGELKIVEISDLHIERELAFVAPIGQRDAIVDRFCNFVRHAYNNML